jgi:hypothetical protein
MKKLGFIFASLFVLVAVTSTVNAQTATSIASAEASARIVAPIEISKVADLKFGNIAAGPSAGIVEISTNDNRTSNGGVTLIAAGNVSNAAAFDITGYPNATFTISLPENISLTSGSDQMEVNNFVSDLGNNSTLDNAGEAQLKVGATLNVEANQAVGLYTGSFDVTVAYN